MYKTALDYFYEPNKESCYQYLKSMYGTISSDVGKYGAFVNCNCETPMEKFFEDIEKLAAFLNSKGYKKGDVISVFLPTSANAFTIFYALSKLGVIAAFIHPLTPPAALKEMLETNKSKGLFILDRMAGAYGEIMKEYPTVVCSVSDYTEGAVRDFVLADEAKVCNVPMFENTVRFYDIINGDYDYIPDCEHSSRDAAVYLAGSGTTGKSKTVILSSYALNQLAYKQVFIDKYHEYGKAYSLCVLPLFHAFGIGASLHMCICNAYTPVIMTKFDAQGANELIRKYNIQYISGAPSMFVKMFDAPNFVNEGLKNLNVLYSGGDIVSEAFIEKFDKVLAENGSKGKLFRGWGLTEMSAICSTNSHIAYKAESIGPVVHGLKVAVFDEDKNPLPPNTNGEIALSGETMMNGYLQDGDVNYSGIYTDPEGVNWVCTGDMGYVDEDGFVFFTGRKKRIIIISSYNVYPYSIEQLVMTLPFVHEACAVQGYDEKGKSVVKLCITLKSRTPDKDTENEIFDFCKKNLNGFSVPRKIEFYEVLPRTKMDKLDFIKMSDAVPK